MTDTDDQIVALILFNEKVKQLLELSFVKVVTAPDAGFSIKVERRGDGSFDMFSTRKGPSIEAVKAFLPAFQFFFHDGETVFLRDLAVLYDTDNIDPQQRDDFRAARDEVDSILDSPSLFSPSYDAAAPTNRQVMDIYVYGGLAHVSPEKYQVYRDWTSTVVVATIFQSCFNKILGRILRMLAYIARVNETTILQLAGANRAASVA